MNLGRRKIQKAVSTSPWAALMVPKSASFSVSIYYQINLINNLLACICMMDWYFLINTSKQKTTDPIREDIIEIFKNAGFKFEIKTNLHIVDFLDITFNLSDETYKPYKKPNDQLLYVKSSSNHLPQIIKQLPISISNRLSNNSLNK